MSQLTPTMTISNPQAEHWRRCNSCKKPIPFGSIYWVCNVSTCNRKRTGLVFCDVSCWDAHLPLMNHREAWAEERKAPTRAEWEKLQSGEGEEKLRRKRTALVETAAPAATPKPPAPPVILRRPKKD